MSEKRVHFVGIGGIGMSALARIMVARGWRVSGSDARESGVTEVLQSLGIQTFVGHDANHVPADATVVYSSAVSLDNPERQAPCKRQVHRSELLQELMVGKRVLAVAGTHGKTTTTAMLIWALQQLGESPSYALGGLLNGCNGVEGSGPWFVVEADESDGSFLRMHPEAAIVTNLESEHMEYWQKEEALLEAFQQFIGQSSRLYWCEEDTTLHALCSAGTPYRSEEAGLNIWGEHNRLNAAGVFLLLRDLGFDPDAVRDALESFPGVERRLTLRGEAGDLLIFDDYAHHPTEVAVTLAALRERYRSRRVVALFQPHRYSRTLDCMGLWREAFQLADLTLITEIYSAGENPNGLTHREVAEECGGEAVDRANLVEMMCDRLTSDDVLVCMGAGDITQLSLELAERVRSMVALR